MTRAPLDDEAARRLIREDLGESLLVEAAAGTGKTTALVSRLVAVLRHGDTTVDRLVAVTFTRKAAGELKLRLRRALDAARGEASEATVRARLQDAIAHLEEARIGTIHSFCAELLRERPVEAGVDPAFGELDDETAAGLYGRAFDGWVQERLEVLPPGLRRALSRLGSGRTWDDRSPLERLRDAGWALTEWRDYRAPWERPAMDREGEVDALVERVEELARFHRLGPKGWDYLREAIAPASLLAGWIERTEAAAGGRDYDELEARLRDLYYALNRNKGWKGRGKYAEGVARQEVVAARDATLRELDGFRERADAELAWHLRQELSEVIGRYETLKQREGKLDFLDLLLRARDLLVDHPEVRGELQRRFTHVFVDEFQDTDPLQAEVLLLLSADDPETSKWREVRPAPGKLFLVGDPKQSIYRFRRADVLLYQAVKEQLTRVGVRLLHLTRSFRAVRGLQEAVNAAFAPEMQGDRESGQAEYVPLEEYRQGLAGQPSLVALPVPAPYGVRNIHRGRISEEQPSVVAAFVAWLLQESGWRVGVPGEGGETRPVGSRDVCLLFRRFLSWGSDLTRDYVGELEARGVPHLLIGGRSFHQREEVETLRAAITAVEWPDDELAVFATLKGSLFAISDRLLLRYREGVGTLHPFRPRPEALTEELEPVAEALSFLADCHRRRNRVPVVHTLSRLLERTRAHAAFALRPAGSQVLANVQHVSDLARRYELSGGISFRGFVERLAEHAERGSDGQAPVLEEGAEGVRLMTVHNAKGLEFPVVVLVDVTCSLSRNEPERHLDPAAGLCALRLLGCAPQELVDHAEVERARDRAEGVRVAYVAATRARDLLVVPTVGDEPVSGWVEPLQRALYPEPQRYRQAEPAPGCPSFGPATVLERPAERLGDEETSVRPGLHRPQAGEHRVVWWDPEALELEVEGHFGLLQEEILREDEGYADDEGLSRYRAWEAQRQAVVERGARKRFEVVTVTAATDFPPGFEPSLEQLAMERRESRPGGRRFGTLVHTVLQHVPFGAERVEVEALARLQGKVLGSTDSEVEAALDTVWSAIHHPVVLRAAAAPRCLREAPFVLPLGDGRLVEGTLDLAFREEDGWTVVDFKTDAELADAGGRYQRQLAWYVYAVEHLTGEPARGVLLVI